MKKEKYIQPSLFDFCIDDELEKTKEIENIKKVSKEEEITNKIRQAIFYYINNNSLDKANFGSYLESIIYFNDKIDDFKINISNNVVKFANLRDIPNRFNIKEGSLKAFKDTIKLKINIENKNNQTIINDFIEYDFGYLKSENELIDYYPSQFKISNEKIDIFLKKVKDKIIQERNKNESSYKQYNAIDKREIGKFIFKIRESDSRTMGSLLFNNINRLERNINREDKKEQSENRSYEIRIDKQKNTRVGESEHILRGSEEIQNGIREFKQKIHSTFRIKEEQKKAILDDIEDKIKLWQEKLIFLGQSLLSDDRQENFNKAVTLLKNFNQKFLERDFYSKIECKYKELIIEKGEELSSDEKDKIIEDFLISLKTNSSDKISIEAKLYISNIMQEKINDLKNINENLKIKLENIDDNLNDLKNLEQDLKSNENKIIRKIK